MGSGMSDNDYSLTINDQQVEARPGEFADRRGGCQQRYRDDPAFLLSQETVGRGQLPHVPGRNRKSPKAIAGLRDAGE